MIDFSATLNESKGMQVENAVLSIVEAKQSLTIFRGKVDELVSQINQQAVDSEEECRAITSLSSIASKLTKEIDKKRKEIIAEPQEFVSTVNRFCKELVGGVDSAVLGAKRKIASYQSRIELERRKQEEAARKAAEELQKKLNAEAKEAGVQPVTVAVPVIPEKKQATRTEEGTSYVVKKWKGEVIDEAQVPREYLSPDQRKIDRAVESGIRVIPGVNIWEASDVRFRTA